MAKTQEKIYYMNDSGIYTLKKGRLFEGNKKLSSLAVRKEGGRLIRCDKNGTPYSKVNSTLQVK